MDPEVLATRIDSPLAEGGVHPGAESVMARLRCPMAERRR